MNMPTRLTLFLLGAMATGFLYLKGATQLPEFGHYGSSFYPQTYGDAINHASIFARHITDSVTGVNFDIRALDTLGEEFILFTSVMGAVVLLREAYEKTPKQDDHEQSGQKEKSAIHAPKATDAVRLWILGMTAPTVLFGFYIVLHGQLTPGGGFQGGVILATAPLLIFLAQDYENFKRITPNTLLEIGESLGAGGYACVGALALLSGAPFLANIFPFGQTGSILSGGIIPLISFLVGLEVAGGFVLLLAAFLQDLFSSSDESKEKESAQ